MMENENDLVYAVAVRVKALANATLPALRFQVGEADTWHGAQREGRGKTRGDLIEEILIEEFVRDFPRTLQENE